MKNPFTDAELKSASLAHLKAARAFLALAIEEAENELVTVRLSVAAIDGEVSRRERAALSKQIADATRLASAAGAAGDAGELLPVTDAPPSEGYKADAIAG